MASIGNNLVALTAMARALRKTLRQKKSRRSHISGWIIAVLGGLLVFKTGMDSTGISFQMVITGLAVLLIVVVLIWEDAINGYVAGKRALPGTENVITVFNEEGFVSTTDIGKTEWRYEKINAVAETSDFFFFIFSANHAQVYDKNAVSGGSVDEFRGFIEEKTEKRVQKV